MFDFQDLKDGLQTPPVSSDALSFPSLTPQSPGTLDTLEECGPEAQDACSPPTVGTAASVAEPIKEPMPDEGTLADAQGTLGAQVESADGPEAVVGAQCNPNEKAHVEEPAVVAEIQRKASESVATPAVAEDNVDHGTAAEGTLGAPLETPGAQVESADGPKVVVEAQCNPDEKAHVEEPAVVAEMQRKASESVATPAVVEDDVDHGTAAEGTLGAPLETRGAQVESTDRLKGVVEAQCSSDEKAHVEEPVVVAETERKVSESVATPDVAEESADAKAAVQAESVKVNEGMAAISSAAAKNTADEGHQGVPLVASATPIAGNDAIVATAVDVDSSRSRTLAPTSQSDTCNRGGCQIL